MIEFFNHGICVCAHSIQTCYLQRMCAEREKRMKKTLRSILLIALWVVLCLVPIQAKAEGENPIELTQDNYKSYLRLGSYNKYYLPSGSYILMEDITLDYTLLIGYEGQINDKDFTDVTVTLDLNGYVLRQGNTQEFPVIQVYQGSTLTIQDSRPDASHKFTEDSTGLWKLDEANGDKTVNGGVITGAIKTGLVLQVMDTKKPDYIARCTMNGGNIVGCTYSSYGGGVCVGDKAKFTMNGGSIRGCTVTDTQHGYGGGVYVVSGTFTMNGGTISDCVSATTDGGDALFMTKGYNAGNSSFSMSDKATINGGFKDANPGASEGSLGVYTVTFDSNGGTPVPSQVRPQGAATVKPADPTLAGWDFGGWYIGENAYDFTQPVTANLTLTAKWTQHIHCVCGENGNHTDIGDHTAHTDEIWTAWTATDSLPTSAGSYYLVNDVDIAEGSRDWDVYRNIKLCLNGKKVTMNGAAITVGLGELSLTDCGDGGKILGGFNASGGGSSVVNLRDHTTLNLYGGSISNTNPANRGNSVVCFVHMAADPVFNMYGGTLGDPDGAVGEDKDGVYIKFADDATNGNIFNAYGGTVRGVISTTIDQENYNEVGNIKFAGTVFESKVYLGKGSTDAPKQSELSGEGQIVYFYPICIYSGTKNVRIDEQNKGDVLGDGGSVSFEYDENGGGGRLTLKDAELSNIVTPITTPFELKIVLKGNNKITTTRQAVFTNKLTFSGNGRLAIETEGESIVCNEMLVNSGDISIFTKSGFALADGNLKLMVNGGTLELSTANTNPKYGVLYTTFGYGTVSITLGADRKMIIGNNSDGTDAVLTEATDKATIGAAKYIYIAGPHIHCLCGENGNHPDIGDHTIHDDVTWIPWTAKDKLPETAGNYYLVNDVVIPEGNSEWEAVGINLCLNGRKVTTNGAAITIGYNYDGDDCFSLTDCAGGGKIIGGASTAGGGSCVVRLEMNETFNLFGGSISSISPKNENNSIVCYDNSANCTFNMYGGTLGDPDGAAGEDSDGIYVRFCGISNRGNIFNAYGGVVRGVISKTEDYVSVKETGTINFGGTVFESKVYLSKGSTNIPEENELSGEGKIVYFYPSLLYNGTERVRIDEQNKDDILGDGGKVKFEYMESDGRGRLTLKDAELVDNGHSVSILAGLDLEIVLSGDNKITGYSGIETTHKLIFSGTGKLTIKISNYSLGIRCDEMIVNSGDISISTEKYAAIVAASGKLTVNGGTLKLATANTDPNSGALYYAIGGNIDADKVIDITLGTDRRMIAGKNSDGTDAVITEATDKTAVGSAKYIYICEKHDHCLCGGNTNIGDHTTHSDLTWMQWTATDKLPDKAGNYYLVNNVTLPDGTVTLPDGVNLCLNGKSVKGAGAGTKLTSDSVITVTDCGTTGSLGELEQIGDNTKLVLYNGKIVSGIFNGAVVCGGEIQDGIFHGNVENNGKITGGIFYGTVSGTGTIADSAKVTVDFDSSGGSAVATQKILRGQKAAAPAAPTKTGSLFGRWTVGGTAFDFATPVIDNITLTAAWTLCGHAASTAKPSCTDQATCTVCGAKYGNALGHSYGAPVYTWNGTSCTAERVCRHNAGHKETETVTAAVTVIQQKTCTLDELSTYTATFTNAAFAVQKKEAVKTADKLGHNFKVQQRNDTQHWNKCSRCDKCDAKKNHIGGTATCITKAECVVCYAKYGEIDTNNHNRLKKVDGVPATAASTGTREHWRCSACEKLFADADGKNAITSTGTILGKLPPSIIEGMNGVWNKEREGGLTFKSDAAYADFIEVLVDNAVISADKYTTREGSIIVELKEDYLATLTEGEHTITIRSASGDAVTKFTVSAAILSPQTGTSNVSEWVIVAVAVLGAICIVVLVVVNHRRKTTETD